MEVVVNEKIKLVEIWLTKAEMCDIHMDNRVKSLCRGFKEKKYRTVVFRSGMGNLEDLTAALVNKNYRKSMAGKL